MPLTEDRTMIEITKESRWKLKRLAATREQPMYQVLDDLILAAERLQRNDTPLQHNGTGEALHHG